jgi:hypothetical protein
MPSNRLSLCFTVSLSISRLEVFTAVLLRIRVFWDVTLCHLVSDSQCFKEL